MTDPTPTNGTSGTAVGSPPSPARDPGGMAPGESPGVSTTGEDPAAELAQLKDRFTKLQTEHGQLSALRDLIDQTPQLRNEVLRVAQGLPPSATAPTEGSSSKVEQYLNEVFEEPVAKGLAEAMKLAIQDAVDTAVGRVDGDLREVRSHVQGSVYERTLEGRGLNREIRDSDDFKTIQRELRSSRTYRQMEGADPAFAAETLANAWEARLGGRLAVDAERRRVDAVKNGTVRGAPRGTAGVQPRYKVRGDDLYAIHKLFSEGVTRDQLDITH